MAQTVKNTARRRAAFTIPDRLQQALGIFADLKTDAVGLAELQRGVEKIGNVEQIEQCRHEGGKMYRVEHAEEDAPEGVLVGGHFHDGEAMRREYGRSEERRVGEEGR